MLGLATFVDNRFDNGIEIFQKLRDYILKNKDFEQLKNKVIYLLSISYFLLSNKLHHLGKITESIECRRKFLELTPNEYDKYITEAIFQVNKKKNPEMALEYVDRAEKLANNDGVWKYNKLYLLIMLGRHSEALDILDNILSTSFESELETVHQVISYNNNCLTEDKNHIQSNFFIGVFYYKKFNQPIAAYEKLEKFVEDTTSIEKWFLLTERAKKYLLEIDKIIGLK